MLEKICDRESVDSERMKNSPMSPCLLLSMIVGYSMSHSSIAKAESMDSHSKGITEATSILEKTFDEKLKEPLRAYATYDQALKVAGHNIAKTIDQRIKQLNDPQVGSRLNVEERAQAIERLESELNAIRDGRLDDLIRARHAITAGQNGEFAPPPFAVSVLKDDVFFSYPPSRKVQFKASARASSEYDNNYLSGNCLDDNRQTEWALRGARGKLSVDINPPVAAKTIYLVSRRFHNDPVHEGEIFINKTLKIPVRNFHTKDVLCVKFDSSIAVSSIDYTISSGDANPGLNDIVLSMD